MKKEEYKERGFSGFEMSKIAVVTGGDSGIGLASAKLLAQNGYSVVVGDLQNTSFSPSSLIRFVKTDVSVESDVKALMETAGNRIDVLVNSAGVVLVKQIPDVLETEWVSECVCLDGSEQRGKK